ncbi:MAG: hypothetical protein WBQ75_08225 [Acetobacteraceae bacterium]
MSDLISAKQAIKAAVGALVSADYWPDASFVRLPFVYPGGTFVTIKIDPLSRSRFRISDGGFGYRELEEIGAQRAYPRTAASLDEEYGVNHNARTIYADATEQEIQGVIADVGAATLRLVDRIYANQREESPEGLVEELTERLLRLFGDRFVDLDNPSLVGASTASWDLTAVLRRDGKLIAFQAVGTHANSVYRTNAAFDDLAARDDAPSLVAVVEDKIALGPRLTLLSRNASIIEVQQPDSAYLSAAA